MAVVPLPSYVKQVRRVLWVTLVINFTVVLVKVGIGLMASSLSVLSDAAHSAIDGLNNMMGLLLMSMVRPYADPEHPYGHAKIEIVGTFGVAAFMAITVVEIVTRAIDRLVTGATDTLNITGFVVAIYALTLLGNIIVIWYERREARRLQSHFLLADVRHTQSDVYVTLGVIAGLTLVALGFPAMDALVSLLVAVLVAFAAFRIVREAVPVLIDRAVYDIAEIRQVAEKVPGVQQAEHIRTRGEGRTGTIELTVRVATTSLLEGHRVADAVEEALQQQYGGECLVTVHVEPADVENAGQDAA